MYVLGVDGGNTKTDYLLHSLDGRMVRHLRAGTCSHEALGLEGAHREMDTRIGTLLAEAGVARADVAAAAFGLAGIDQAVQQADLTDIVHRMGFTRSIAMNDSFLGIKAGSASGVGICSINGTGTASGGIDKEGHWMQVGGIGFISGDDAGGSYLAHETLRRVYHAVYRFGEETALVPAMLALFQLENPEDLHTAISIQYQFGKAVTDLQLVQALLAASQAGDAVARSVVLHTADTLARSAAGCAVRLQFDGPIPIILIGSVWTKGRHQPMLDHFQRQFEIYTKKACTVTILEVPPAAGSILWALELATGTVPDTALRETVFAQTKGI